MHAEQASKASLDIAEKQLREGQINLLTVLLAQQTYLTAVITRLQAEANRLSDTAALVMAPDRPRQTSLWRECVLGAAPVAPKISLPRAVGHQTTNAHKSENGSTMMPR